MSVKSLLAAYMMLAGESMKDLPKCNDALYGTGKKYDGKNITPEEWKNKQLEQGRNELCKCGSNLKYKKCCGRLK